MSLQFHLCDLCVNQPPGLLTSIDLRSPCVNLYSILHSRQYAVLTTKFTKESIEEGH